MVEEGLEMSDKVNHHILSTESMEPLLAEVQYFNCTEVNLVISLSKLHLTLSFLWILTNYCNNGITYIITRLRQFRGPITKISQSDCSVAGPIFSSIGLGMHYPELSRTKIFS